MFVINEKQNNSFPLHTFSCYIHVGCCVEDYGKICMTVAFQQHSPLYSFTENLTEIATICTESGIWQPIAFTCVFDPLAINLKKPGDIGGKHKILLHKIFPT